MWTNSVAECLRPIQGLEFAGQTKRGEEKPESDHVPSSGQRAPLENPRLDFHSCPGGRSRPIFLPSVLQPVRTLPFCLPNSKLTLGIPLRDCPCVAYLLLLESWKGGPLEPWPNLPSFPWHPTKAHGYPSLNEGMKEAPHPDPQASIPSHLACHVQLERLL